MRILPLTLALVVASPLSASSAEPPTLASPDVVRTVKTPEGWYLTANGKRLMVFGMNWAYMPIGENYSYDFWGKDDAFIREALDSEMTLLRNMGVNVIRVYVGIPKRWITYIYENYGIWTVLNHAMGRYGMTIDGVWVAPTNYADPRTREVIRDDILGIVREYKNTKGLLMWLLGNENNYGLYWAGGETEDLPEEQQQDARATYLYTLYGEITDGIHQVDDNHPVAIANGDLQYIDLIAQHAPNIDVMGSNVYRGKSSGDLFDVVSAKLDKPFMYTEFGADAYDAKRRREDQYTQAEVLRALWQEIYEHSAGKGRAGNAIGGMTFQWSDGWWKYEQTVNLDVHDTTASWSNAAYPVDYQDDANNMNEEWFGICGKGQSDERGLYEVFPRAAYYVLQKGYELDPYAASTTLTRVRQHWGSIEPREMGDRYVLQSLTGRVDVLESVRVSNLMVELETFTTGGERLDDPDRARERFDHLQSVYVDVEVNPSDDVRANVSLNVLGNVASNPINEIFFENRALNNQGEPFTFIDPNGDEVVIPDVERLKLYQASFEWKGDWFELEGFYRRGHYHWAYEGDFFNIYQEANYEPQVDMFNADAPNGFEFTGKEVLEGLKIAAGPELTWGANPTVIAKYYREVGNVEFSLMHQEDLAQRANAPTSSALPVPRTRKTAAYLGVTFGRFKLEIGGLMAGTDRLDQRFTIANRVDGPGYLESGYEVLDDTIEWADTLGAKAKLTYSHNNINLYVQGGYKGLVADSGYDQTITFTGWGLKDSGKGNNYNVFAGGTYNIGDFQFAPNFMFQRPLEGPLPFIEDLFDPATGRYYPGVTLRNQFADPFWVRENRETYGAELLIAYDPTGATWAWAWDNVIREDAPFAGFIDFIYKVLPTSQDGGVAVAQEGFIFAFAGAPPARDLWEVRGRMIFNPDFDTHIVVDGYGGITQSTGDSQRLVTRGGANVRVTHRRLNFSGFVKVNDWGPYDYHRDFNLTFPLQTMADLSYGVSSPEWFVRGYTRFGAAFQLRLLDEFSNRYLFDPTNPDALGNEWEVKTYVQIAL